MKGRASEQSSQVQKDLLRSVTIPRLLALETMSQDLVRRVERPADVQTHVLGGPIFRPSRLPLLGLRSQRELKRGRFNVLSDLYAGQMVLDTRNEYSPSRTVCMKRQERREVLFALGIAGKGQRRSPGAGGSYRRTIESQYTCKKVR